MLRDANPQTKVGDGDAWTLSGDDITVKGDYSAFYSIEITK